MKDRIDNLLESTFGNYLKDLKELVAIESVRGTPDTNAPYGIKPKEALDKALKIAQNLGFETTMINDVCGYASYGPNTEDYLGIFGHVDVVPLEEGWKYAPLGFEIDNNKIYGRGVLDNKGPILINLYAVYIMKELGITFPYEIRVVFGTNEETGMQDMPIYLEYNNPPFFGWTPDCKFPVIYGERGRATLRLYKNKTTIENFYQVINKYFLQTKNNGQALGINFSDNDFGELIMRGYKLGYDKDHYFQCSLSYPNITAISELKEKISQRIGSEMSVDVINNVEPVLKDKNNPHIKILSDVYHSITNYDATPLTTTGGTYAKIIPNIVAFGPSFPRQNGIAHLPDEWIDIDDLKMCYKIYALSLYELSKNNKGGNKDVK